MSMKLLAGDFSFGRQPELSRSSVCAVSGVHPAPDNLSPKGAVKKRASAGESNPILAKEFPKKNSVCEGCGDSFSYCRLIYTGRPRRFCSFACYRRSWRLVKSVGRKFVVTASCKQCGVAMQVVVGSRGRLKTFCSKSCNSRFRYRRLKGKDKILIGKKD